MRRTRIALFILGLLFVFVLAWLICLAQMPVRPNLAVGFLGYTNDSTRAAVVRFSITNLNTSPAIVYSPMVITQENKGAFFGYPAPFFHETINPDQSQIVAFPAPTNQPQWKLHFYCYPTIGAARVVRNVAVLISDAFRIGHKGQTMPYDISSDWINGSTNVANTVSAP